MGRDSIADVVVKGEYDDSQPFVIEVYVTHANEDEKVQYFDEEDIPFLEVVPIRKTVDLCSRYLMLLFLSILIIYRQNFFVCS